MNQYRQNEKDVPNCFSIGKLVSVLHRRAQAFYTRYLKEYDISLAEYPVLFMLSTHEPISKAKAYWNSVITEGMTKEESDSLARLLEAALDNVYGHEDGE